MLNSPPASRLTPAFIAALILHAILILGIQFTSLAPPAEEPVLSFNITLLEQAGSKPGTATGALLSPPIPITPEPIPPEPLVPALSPPDKVINPSPVVTTQQAPKIVPPKPQKNTSSESATVRPLPAPAAAAPNAKQALEKPASPAVDAVDLMNRGIQMARLNDSAQSEDADSARVKRINQESMTTLEKFYMQAWERKVEQVGTLNFPEEARRLKLSSGPVLDVAIRANGSVHSIAIVRSSGHPALDKAAHRIVELAAPFAPFPTELRRQYDILHIVRRWRFEQGRLLP